MTIRIDAGPWATRDLAESLGGAVVMATCADAGGFMPAYMAVQQQRWRWGCVGTFRVSDRASGKVHVERVLVGLPGVQ